MGDMKEALGSSRKPDMTQLSRGLKVYTIRAHEYGCDKYERENYRRMPDGTAADAVAQIRVYSAALERHLTAFNESINEHQANDYHFEDLDGLKRAVYCADMDPDTTGKVGPSGLPHLCGAAASLSMLITKAIKAGLLPEDPGQPWTEPTADKGSGCNMCGTALDSRWWAMSDGDYCDNCHSLLLGDS